MNSLTIRSIDIMKLTKDTVNKQQSPQQIQSAVAAIKSAYATHVAVSVPMNSNTEMQANNNKPSPLSIEAYTQMICDVVHAAGLGVLFRGTYCECETIYNFPLHKDTAAYWIAKAQTYITSNPNFFRNGDIFAPFPESTNVIPGHGFGDIFLNMPGGTQDYATFFIALHSKALSTFAQIGKTVTCGLSTNNYSEINSGWIPPALFDDAKMIVIDDYETPSVLDQHLRALYQAKGGKYPIFQQEWGLDYQTGDPVQEMQAFCTGTASRVADGVQTGLNYWGGWTGALESIFALDANGNYVLNAQGQVLAAFYKTFVPPPVTTPPAFTAKGTATIISDGKGTVSVSLTNVTL